MLRCASLRLGAAVSRTSAASKATAVAAAAGAKHRGRGRPPKSGGAKRAPSPAKNGARAASKTPKSPRSPKAPKALKPPRVTKDTSTPAAPAYSPGRPRYMTEKREKEVLAMADRMQQRDLSGEVPVASFAFEILKAHPSVRDMGLRERMDFLCTRWAKLPANKRMEYLNDPLKGLM